MTKQEAIGASQTANVKSVMTVRATAKNGPGVKRKLYIGLMKFLMGISITITCGLVLFMIGYVLYRGVPNISWKLVSTSPSYLDDNIGILPDILNTLYIVIATLVIVLPLGVGAAIYLTEYATNKKIVGMIEYAAETLSGIPSIIYGLVGMLFFCQFLSLQTSLFAAVCPSAFASAFAANANASSQSDPIFVRSRFKSASCSSNLLLMSSPHFFYFH
jgi:ABC-type phosphate transport system permease subunit